MVHICPIHALQAEMNMVGETSSLSCHRKKNVRKKAVGRSQTGMISNIIDDQSYGALTHVQKIGQIGSLVSCCINCFDLTNV